MRSTDATDAAAPGGLVAGSGAHFGGTPVLSGGELHGYGREDKEEQRRSRDVPVPLEDRGDQVDDERGHEPREQEPALPVLPGAPGGPRGVAHERGGEAGERQES